MELQEWFAARDQIRALYFHELGRDVAGDPDAITNWLYHVLDQHQSIDWVRDRIRESDEWREKHPKPTPDPPPIIVPVPSPTPIEPLPPPPMPSFTPTAGFHEHASARTIRPRLTRDQIGAFLPERGPFTFPDPYRARGIRLTNASDGTVRPIGMSYWSNVNNHAGMDTLMVLLSINDRPTIFLVEKATGQVQRGITLPFVSTGEGAYWSATHPNVCFVPQHGRLWRYFVGPNQAEPAFDVPGDVKQCHSSADGTVHSMTLDGGAAVWHHGELGRFPSVGAYDECQIDKSGRWLLIKEANANRIVDLNNGRDYVIFDPDGAVGHSDMGYGYMVGEEDQSSPGGVFRLWRFTDDGPSNEGHVYYTDWTSMSRYIAHGNAQPGAPDDQYALVSASHDGDVPRANELVIVPLDGSFDCRIICPNLTDLSAPGGGDLYWRKTRANLDPVGAYACWTANCGTERMDAFLVSL